MSEWVQESDSMCKGIKILCSLQLSWNGVFLFQKSSTEKGGHVAGKESAPFCHVPMVWMFVETTENMAALNVDYSAWIITVLSIT